MAEKIKNLEELLTQFLGSQKKLVSSEISRLTPPGENYLSVVLKVDVVLRDEETGIEENLRAVGKCIHSSDVHESMIRYGKMNYNSERIWYTIIVPTLENFLKVEQFDGNFDLFPKLIAYRANLHGKNDQVDGDSILLMENLTVDGYSNIDRRLGFDYDGAKRILEDIATFHAIPLAMKLKKPNLYDESIKKHLIRPNLESKEPKEGNEPRKPPNTGFDVWLEIFETHDDCKPYLQGLKKVFDFVEENPDIIWERKDFREPFATISHNDLWVNNTMQVFIGDKILKNKFVDFQMYSCSSPTDDLLFFIWTSVQLSVIKDYFSDLLKHYHKTFVEVLRGLGCDISEFSYEKLEEEMKVSTKFELCHSLCMSEVIFAKKGQFAFDMTQDPDLIQIKKEEISEEVIERFLHIVKMCGERGWI